jgi:hypothetical protein
MPFMSCLLRCVMHVLCSVNVVAHFGFKDGVNGKIRSIRVGTQRWAETRSDEEDKQEGRAK